MFSKAIALSMLVAYANARFGQEQVPIPQIAAVNGGAPGVAATIAGAAISDLLAAANPCAKLSRGDQILAELGTGADAIAAAKNFVAAEQNFNPFVVSVPNICSDIDLPKNPLLRGITPLIDPAVAGSAAVIALSKQSVTTPFDATGKSVADVLRAHGFSNFTAVALDGTKIGPIIGGAAVPPPATSAAAIVDVASTTAAITTPASTTIASAVAGAIDYGKCDPQMDFLPGRNGRKATEFTFAPIDALIGGQEALNPNIITDRTCNQLTNVCGANAAAKAQCQFCKIQVAALTVRDQSTADTWNKCLIASTNIVQDTTSIAAPLTTSSPALDIATGSTVTVTKLLTTVSMLTVTAPCNVAATAIATSSPPAATSAASTSGTIKANVQPFTGSLGVPAVPIQQVAGDRPFVVNGNSFVNFAAACQRSCDIQQNACSNAANAGGQTFSVGDCGTQQGTCNAGCSAGPTKRVKREARWMARA